MATNQNGTTPNWLNELYKQAFPHLETIKDNKDITTQIEGVDKWFYCKNARPYRIEEKFRNENYNDLLLEDYSNWTTKRPGWARDSQKTTDFLAYIFLPKKVLWVFWYPPLRQYFLTNYDTLYRKYVTESRARDYKWGETFGPTGELLFRTANIPVPLAEFPKTWLAKNFWEYLYLTKNGVNNIIGEVTPNGVNNIIGEVTPNVCQKTEQGRLLPSGKDRG